MLTSLVVFSNVIAAISDSIHSVHQSWVEQTMMRTRSKTRSSSSRRTSVWAQSSTAESKSSNESKSSSPGAITFFRALGLWCACVLIGTLFFKFFPGEERDLITALYASVVALTTVGFGDQLPRTERGKVFVTIWMLVGVSLFANMVAKFAVAFTYHGVKKLDATVLNGIHSSEFFQKCNADTPDNERRVSRADFLLFMTMQMGLLDDGPVRQMLEDFETLDRDGSGVLDMHDLHENQLKAAYS